VATNDELVELMYELTSRASMPDNGYTEEVYICEVFRNINLVLLELLCAYIFLNSKTQYYDLPTWESLAIETD